MLTISWMKSDLCHKLNKQTSKYWSTYKMREAFCCRQWWTTCDMPIRFVDRRRISATSLSKFSQMQQPTTNQRPKEYIMILYILGFDVHARNYGFGTMHVFVLWSVNTNLYGIKTACENYYNTMWFKKHDICFLYHTFCSVSLPCNALNKQASKQTSKQKILSVIILKIWKQYSLSNQRIIVGIVVAEWKMGMP